MTVFDFSLKDKVAIVTGASRGIGKAIALAFADAGADVVAADILIPEMEAVAAEIRAKGRRALAIKTDVSSKQDVDNMMSQTLKEFGTVDTLVNNAAKVLVIPTTKVRENSWDKIFDIDVKGCYLCAQAVSEVMIENKKGCIINISSGAGITGNPYEGAYAVAKAAVIHLNKVLATELGRYNIRVNCIAPGVIRTKMAEGVFNDPATLKRFSDAMPMKRLGEPDEIAAVTLFLASDAASYVNGVTICVDGGAVASGFDTELIGKTLPPELQLP